MLDRGTAKHAATVTNEFAGSGKPGETMSSRKLTVDAELEKLQLDSNTFCMRRIQPTGW